MAPRTPPHGDEEYPQFKIDAITDGSELLRARQLAQDATQEKQALLARLSHLQGAMNRQQREHIETLQSLPAGSYGVPLLPFVPFENEDNWSWTTPGASYPIDITERVAIVWTGETPTDSVVTQTSQNLSEEPIALTASHTETPPVAVGS